MIDLTGNLVDQVDQLRGELAEKEVENSYLDDRLDVLVYQLEDAHYYQADLQSAWNELEKAVRDHADIRAEDSYRKLEKLIKEGGRET